MNIKKRIYGLTMAMMMMVAVGCTSEQEHLVPDVDVDQGVEIDDQEREVTFVTGAANGVFTRAEGSVAFVDGTPIKIYIYKYTGETIDYTDYPFKVAEGKLVPSTNEGLSTVKFTGGDVSQAGILTLRSGVKYDFVAVIAASEDINGNLAANAQAIDADVVVSNGVISLTSGHDLLVARKTMKVDYSTDPVQVNFDENGATNNVIPRLGCGVGMELSFTQYMIEDVEGYGNYLRVKLLGFDFEACMPGYTTLGFGDIGTPIDITQWDTTLSIDCDLTERRITTETDLIKTGWKYIMPYPLSPERIAANEEKNRIDLNFRLRINNKIDVDVLVDGVEVVPFEAGYRYKFIVTIEEVGMLDFAKVTIALQTSSWNGVTWANDIGGATRAAQVVEPGKYVARLIKK